MSDLPTPGVYAIDPVHSTIGFVARHLVASKVRGVFTDFSGNITVTEPFEGSSVAVTVQAGSVTTNNEMRDGHLKSADFFELEKYPTLEFTSNKLVHKSGTDYELSGLLTVHGVTKEVTFDLEYLGTSPGMAPGVTVVGFEASTDIDRRDFGVVFQGTLENGSLIVSNKITIEIAIEAAKQD